MTVSVNCSTVLSAMVFGLPSRGRSESTLSIPKAAKRSRICITLLREMPTRRAISVWGMGQTFSRVQDNLRPRKRSLWRFCLPRQFDKNTTIFGTNGKTRRGVILACTHETTKFRKSQVIYGSAHESGKLRTVTPLRRRNARPAIPMQTAFTRGTDFQVSHERGKVLPRVATAHYGAAISFTIRSSW